MALFEYSLKMLLCVCPVLCVCVCVCVGMILPLLWTWGVLAEVLYLATFVKVALCDMLSQLSLSLCVERRHFFPLLCLWGLLWLSAMPGRVKGGRRGI